MKINGVIGEKSRIVFDVRMINSSGIGTYIQNFIPALINQFDLILIGKKSDLIKYNWYSPHIKHIESATKIYTVKEQLDYFFKIPKCDLFISPHYNSPFLPIAAKKKMTFIPDVNHVVFRDDMNFFKRLYSNVMLNNAIKNSDLIVTISNFSYEEIKKFFHISKNVFILPLGVDVTKYQTQHSSIRINYIKTKYGLPDSYILFVGNVKPHKNLKNLLLAVDMLYRQNKISQKLIIVGKIQGFINPDSEIFHIVREKSHLSKNVIFTDFVVDEDLPDIYKGASLFCFPSLYEGFGLPPLEAMASGCPTLVSNRASLPEVCGNASYYVNPLSIDNIASGIEDILSNPQLRNSLTSKGYDNVEKFSWQTSSAKLIELIYTVLYSQN